jgi:IclR family pca regulon transcriptional regulator
MADTLHGRDFVQAIERGLSVILAFADHHPLLSLTEVAQATGLSRPTVRRILLTLRELGYVRMEGRMFGLTPRILAVGYAYLSSLSLTEIAQPHMEWVIDQTRESCSLSTLDGTDVVYVSRVQTHRVASLTLATGTRLPAYATAMGRVLLADLPTTQLERYLATVDFRPLTPRTVGSARELRRRLDEVRRQGWAFVDQELEDGLRALSAPVRAANGQVIAALSMSYGTGRPQREAEQRFLPVLLTAARKISEQLGAHFTAEWRRRRPPEEEEEEEEER